MVCGVSITIPLLRLMVELCGQIEVWFVRVVPR